MMLKKRYLPLLVALTVFSACNKKTEAVSTANAATEVKKPVSLEVATVNDMTLTSADINPYLAQGADRAVAVDRAINKALAAELAKKEFSEDTKAALGAAERDVAAQVYLSKKAEAVGKAVSDKDIEARYNILVKDADFNAYKLKVAITQTEQEANDLIAKVQKAGDVEKKFAPLSTQGEGYVGKNDVPYGLGAVISQLGNGQYSKPLVTRNGVMIFNMVDVKHNDKPKLADAKEQVRASLTQERVSEAILKARESAKITLK